MLRKILATGLAVMGFQLFMIHALGIFAGNHGIDYQFCQALIVVFACLTINPLAAPAYLFAFNAGRSGVGIPHWALSVFLLLMICIARSGKPEKGKIGLK